MVAVRVVRVGVDEDTGCQGKGGVSVSRVILESRRGVAKAIGRKVKQGKV